MLTTGLSAVALDQCKVAIFTLAGQQARQAGPQAQQLSVLSLGAVRIGLDPGGKRLELRRAEGPGVAAPGGPVGWSRKVLPSPDAHIGDGVDEVDRKIRPPKR